MLDEAIYRVLAVWYDCLGLGHPTEVTTARCVRANWAFCVLINYEVGGGRRGVQRAVIGQVERDQAKNRRKIDDETGAGLGCMVH